MYSGLIHLPWWGYVAVTLVLTHITIAGVTIFLHRHQAHRALEMHPLISHFFRLWLWLTTGMVTKHWTAIHRKHHARSDLEGDPHSPQVVGIKKVLWQGAELYKAEAKNAETLEKYGHGTPDDWLERNVYTPHSVLGIGTMLTIDVVLFGPIGITIWAVQMLWIPLFAAGVINGIGHYWGYRNFTTEEASTNIVPWGIIIGGEELHNNHHAHGSSAKLSSQWWEFDIGWLYIRILETLGLAQVKKLAPKIELAPEPKCDQETVHAVITHRYHVLARYGRSLKQTCTEEIAALRTRAVHVDQATVKRWLHTDEQKLPAPERARMQEVRRNSKVLDTIYSMRQELAALWQRSSASREQLVQQLEDWCHRAEASGIAALQEFSHYLRRYQVAPV